MKRLSFLRTKQKFSAGKNSWFFFSRFIAILICFLVPFLLFLQITIGVYMKIISEFKEFAVKGNVMDLAIGVIIGAAFGKIVSSLVTDIITPPIGLMVGGIDFTNLSIVLKEAIDKKPAVTINYGKFIQTCFDFVIIAWSIFMVVKGINVMKRKKEAEPEPAPAEPTKEELLLTEIRDILKSK